MVDERGRRTCMINVCRSENDETTDLNWQRLKSNYSPDMMQVKAR